MSLSVGSRVQPIMVKKKQNEMEAMSCTVTYNGERTESAGIGTEKILRIRLLDNLKDTLFVWVIAVESLQPPVIAQKLN